jgi:hypothetical protein
MKVPIYPFKEVDNYKGKKVPTLDRTHNKNTSSIRNTITPLCLSPCILYHGKKTPRLTHLHIIDPSCTKALQLMTNFDFYGSKSNSLT